MIALDVELEDHRVMDEPVDSGDGHCLVEEDGIPGTEWLVGGDERGSALVARGDQLEEDASLGLVLLHVGEIVVDREVILCRALRWQRRGSAPGGRTAVFGRGPRFGRGARDSRYR